MVKQFFNAIRVQNFGAIFTIVFLGLLATTKTVAQQVPLFSQYFHNPFIYNPAWAGLDKFGSANLTYRNQWEGMPSAPVTNQFTLDLPFYQYKAGAGINVYHEKIGLFTTTKVQASFAYHLFPLYENASAFSFGLTAGYVGTRMDLTNIYVLNPGDPRIINNTGDYQGVEFSFGVNYRYRDKFQIGLVAPQFVSSGLRPVDGAENNLDLVSHYLLTAKCTLKSYDEMHRVEPMIMLRKAPRSPLQFDIGAQYTYNNTLWGSVAYRANYTVSIAAGVNVKRFRIGYARDFSTGALAGVAGSSNEIMVGYKFGFMPTYDYDGKKGKSNTKIKRKIMHPSKPGPLPKDVYKKGNPKKAPKGYRRG
jgi:type IX secretion system PorP/SprF family membrane protein